MFTALNQEGATVYTVFSRSPQTNWSVVIGIPAEEIEGPIQRLLMLLGGTGAALMVFSLSVTAMVGRAILRQRKAYEGELNESQSKLQLALTEFQELVTRIPVGIYKLRMSKDGVNRFDYVSPRFCEQIGVTQGQVQNGSEPTFNWILPDDLPELIRLNELARQSLQPFSWEGRVIGAKGTRWMHVESTAMLLPDGDILWNGSQFDVTERKQLEEEIRKLAFYDSLTNLPNRRLLMDRLTQAMAAGKRSDTFGALIFLDLDNFKPLNDAHGHGAGDLLLVEVARRLRGCVRAVDTVSRLGGDEFVVLLGDMTTDPAQAADQANTLAEKVRVTLCQPYVITTGHEQETIRHECSASIGVVVFSKQHQNLEDLLKWADAAMYQSKAEGRNRISFLLERRARQRPRAVTANGQQ